MKERMLSHLSRLIDRAIDPVALIKIPLFKYIYNIKSMRQTIRDIRVNMAYRWFLGIGVYVPFPTSHIRQELQPTFKETDRFEQIFERV